MSRPLEIVLSPITSTTKIDPIRGMEVKVEEVTHFYDSDKGPQIKDTMVG